ncbi:MAG: hypothetical protein AB1390_00580 [Nitrospirota bacterium]
MRFTMEERQKITAAVAGRYQGARKKDKGIVLNEFVALTGYTRSYQIGDSPVIPPLDISFYFFWNQFHGIRIP